MVAFALAAGAPAPCGMRRRWHGEEEGYSVGAVTRLFDEAAIARRVEELASEIARAISGEFTIVGLLKGSFVFVADLVRALDRAGRAPRVEFMQLRSYGCGRESSGDVRLIGEVPQGIEGRRILLVDDIADTGWSLVYARNLLQDRGASEIRICALVDKPSRRKVELSLDFVGFTVGDVFVVGYGIDWAEAYRHLPYIGSIE
jgi:hypoxanthine phosphoribosyltransferase